MATCTTSIPTGGNGARVEIGTQSHPGMPITLACRLGGDTVQIPLVAADAWKVVRELLYAIGDTADREDVEVSLPRSAWACIEGVQA